MCRLWPWAHLNSCRPTEASGGNAAFFILFLWFTDFKCWINLLIQRMWASTKPRPERRPLTENCDTDVFSNIVTKHKVYHLYNLFSFKLNMSICSHDMWSCVVVMVRHAVPTSTFVLADFTSFHLFYLCRNKMCSSVWSLTDRDLVQVKASIVNPGDKQFECDIFGE